MKNAYLAVDLGAESGRVIVGVLEDKRLELNEVHRFPHEPVWLPTGLHWDTTGIWREMLIGLRKAAEWIAAGDAKAVSVGVDTWGVDWALVDSAGELLGLPHAYRDPRNEPAYEEVLTRLGAERIYQATGIQFMPLNSLYSLYAHRLADPGALQRAEQLLFMPDLLHFWLSGNRTVEATIASTSQMLDCHTSDWARDMLREIGIDGDYLKAISPPGTVVGTLRAKLAEVTGLPAELRVVAPASHDTASAVAAVPAEAESNWCFLSSGTWSLLGAEIDRPCVSAEAQAASFTNELGIDGTVRFLKNIPGLWLVQECRRDYLGRGETYDYAELARLASQAAPLQTILDPAHRPFQAAGEMLQKIEQFARDSRQPVPESPGAFVRACLESLALAYREKLETLEAILSRRFEVIHIVGGGGKNDLLNQLTADATRRRIIVGPYEATAIGNALVQAIAAGDVENLAELRAIVAGSFPVTIYEPQVTSGWDAAFERYKGLCNDH